MSELEVLHRIERLARDVKMNTYTVLSDRNARCGYCGQHPEAARGVQNQVRMILMKELRELEAALVELDLVRAGARASP